VLQVEREELSSPLTDLVVGIEIGQRIIFWTRRWQTKLYLRKHPRTRRAKTSRRVLLLWWTAAALGVTTLAFSFAARLSKDAMHANAEVDRFETAPTVQHDVQKAPKHNNRAHIVDGACTHWSHVRDEKPSL
jgi:hypothetical protein